MSKIKSAILGFAVGDALGVPVEFKSREELDRNPVTDMREYGTYHQPKGTWSDDTSMTLATLYSFNRQHWTEWRHPSPLTAMIQFQNWYVKGVYTPYGKTFDVGRTTRNAIEKFGKTFSISTCGQGKEQDNGNGALMRMLPLAFLPMNETEFLETTRKFTIITHKHKRNVFACQFFVIAVHRLLSGESAWLKKAYEMIDLYAGDEKEHFSRIPYIMRLTRDEIKSTGYVINTLEAALWCFLTTNNYADCVLTAVNLGGDTDTIAAIAGGLAGIKYGVEGIPKEWLLVIARYDIICQLCDEFDKTLSYILE
jgi:ADP-ribosylglycohydrolase